LNAISVASLGSGKFKFSRQKEISLFEEVLSKKIIEEEEENQTRV
jgi:hypothetical protein